MIRDGEGHPITKPLSAREKHWLRAYLEVNPDALSPGHSDEARSNQVRSTETIVEDLSNRWDDRGILDLVKKWRESHFLPDSDLAWISSSNQRQLIWLINELAIRLSVITPPDYFDASTAYVPDPLKWQSDQRYPLIIAAIDAWPIGIEKKRTALDELKEKWGRAQIPEKQLKWLDSKDSEQMAWAINYLGACDFWKRHRTKFTFPPTDNPKDKYAHILGFLDHLYGISPDTQELFLAKMKKTWSQRKYLKSEKAKKQVYFSLSDEARRHLDQLEKARKVTKNRIIEDLLAQAVGPRR